MEPLVCLVHRGAGCIETPTPSCLFVPEAMVRASRRNLLLRVAIGLAIGSLIGDGLMQLSGAIPAMAAAAAVLIALVIYNRATLERHDASRD